jgi:hypothetical protein
MFGLTEEKSYRLALKKGLLVEGLRTDDETILGQSVESWMTNQWFYLYLRFARTQHGDTHLSVLADTSSGIDPSSPSMSAVDGIPAYYDDQLGIINGEIPIVGDIYVGFGVYNRNASGTLSLFDYFKPGYQSSF